MLVYAGSASLSVDLSFSSGLAEALYTIADGAVDAIITTGNFDNRNGGLYAKGKFKAIEPKILADAWRYDSAVSAIVGGPGRAAFGGVAAFDAKIVDGAVNGIGSEVRAASGLLRKMQSGLVRSYAFVIGLGAVVLLAWFLLRGIL